MAAGKGLVPSPPEPLLARLFEIYGKIFGLSQWSGGHRWVALEGSVEQLGVNHPGRCGGGTESLS